MAEVNENTNTVTKITRNYDSVCAITSSYKNYNSSFVDDKLLFFDSQIDSIKFTGRDSYGNVDANDALSINVIDSINEIKVLLSGELVPLVDDFISKSKIYAEKKDEIETAQLETSEENAQE